jgi:hypothetical protein
MSKVPEYHSDPIAYLLRRKFGEAAVTGPVSGVQEDDRETEAQISEELQAYRAQLQGLAEEQLFALAYQEREKEASELVDAQEQGRFFNQPEARADYEYWGRLPLWTLDEAVALTLEKTPALVTWSKIEEYAESSPFAAHFATLRHFVLRAKEAQRLPELVSPTDYIAWANANKVTLPSELKESVQAFSGEVPDWKALYEEEKLRNASTSDELERLKAAGKPLGRREQNTLYKMILGMAVATYEHESRKSRTATSRLIAQDLKTLKLSVDADTVRKWLQKAKDEFGHRLPDNRKLSDEEE